MIQLTPRTRILVVVDAVDFRSGIDDLARICKQQLQADPFSGAVYVFRNRRSTSIKALVYGGQGFWVCQKRLSAGRFRSRPRVSGEASTERVAAHELQVLLMGGDPARAQALPAWRRAG